MKITICVTDVVNPSEKVYGKCNLLFSSFTCFRASNRILGVIDGDQRIKTFHIDILGFSVLKRCLK